jgi:ADP-heptose:LPS heptosyltransferase
VSEDRPTVLVLRALGLGDFFTGLPALALLRRALPEHRIVLALPSWLAPLAALAGTVDATVHGHELSALVDPPHGAELAIDLHGNGPESRALLLATAPRRLLAFNADCCPAWRTDEHEVARWCRLLVDGLPLPAADCPGVAGQLPEPPGVPAPAGTTIVHCGAKAASRRWPADRFAEVAASLAGQGHDVVVTGSGDEAPTAEAIAARAGARAATSLTLLQLLALVARARLVVSGDTGVAHVASNYRVRSVVLFGPVSPRVWGPPKDPRHQALFCGDGRGDPHGTTPDPALLKLSVEDVTAAAEKALAAP